MSLIGLDIGTTGCKCTLFDFDGKTIAFSYKEYPVECPKTGQYELNPEKVWDAVKYVIFKTMDNHKGEELTALSVSSVGEAATPVDSNGNFLYNSILYTDIRGVDQAENLRNKLGKEKIMELTGLTPHSMYTINKVIWIKENMPEIFKKTWKFMLFEDFIIYKLTGTPVIDYSLASRTMTFNVVDKKWEETVLAASEINIDLFSDAMPSGTVVGFVRKEIADELKISHKTLIVTGGHDQACTALGSGIISEGMAVDGMGTAECITTIFNSPVLNDIMIKNSFNCGPHVISNMYYSLAFTSSAGSLLKWFRDSFCLSEINEALSKNINIYKLLDDRASKTPTSIFVLPHFSGSGTPYMDPFSKGLIAGLTLDVSKPQLYRALMEGITYEIRLNLECLESANIKVNTLRAVGGGSGSDLWMQIKADILGQKVETLDTNEAGTLGAAILAGVAAGIYPSLTDAVCKMVKTKKVFFPDIKNHEIYEDRYLHYKKIYQATKQIF